MNNNNIELTISKTLKDLGISPILLGYGYLRHAIKLIMEDPDIAHHVFNKLYPAIAKQFNSTTARVERAIRHSIAVGWLRGNPETQDLLFGYTVDCTKGVPTNGMFIATVADYLLTSEEVGYAT